MLNKSLGGNGKQKMITSTKEEETLPGSLHAEHSLVFEHLLL